MDGSPLVVGIDGRELQGRPTGTGRYLRNLLRRWGATGDTLIVYFSGPPPEEPALDHPTLVRAARQVLEIDDPTTILSAADKEAILKTYGETKQ